MKFYTWIDFQDRFSEYFDIPENNQWLEDVSISVYWDGVHINYASPKNEVAIIDKLKEIFISRFEEENGQYFLLFEKGQKLSVFFEEVEKDDISTLAIKASLSRPPFIARKKIDGNISTRSSESSPMIFSFHSFKGGVGRTLHAVTFALELAKKGKVLLIDADFEAPGISWMIEHDTISLSDLLTLLHGTNDSNHTIKYVADILKDTEKNNLIIMPSFREMESRFPILQIKPEHIYNFNSNTFILTDAIEKLGNELDAQYVIIDLRAGISELSTGWLLDPRIFKFFVTTLSSQSMLGTAVSFKLLSNFVQNNFSSTNKANEPFLIFSQISPTYKDIFAKEWSNSTDNLLVQNLRRAYIDAFLIRKESDIPSSYEGFSIEDYQNRKIDERTIFTTEYEILKGLPQSWDEVTKAIERSGISHQLKKAADEFFTISEPQKEETFSWQDARKNLENYTSKLVFAEKTQISEFLLTDSISKLVTKFRNETPIAVIIGAKGSGKTFLYKQIIQNTSWENFISKASNGHSLDSNKYTFPVTIPLNMDNSPEFESKGGTAAFNITGKDRPSGAWINNIKPYIETQLLNSQLTVSEWRKIWINCIAWSLGFEVNELSAGDNLLNLLKNKKQTVIAVFDGLEDLFKKYNEDASEQKAIESLLQDVPVWLESLPHKPLGIIIFIRKDIVGHAIKQNEGQFLDKYKEFELIWNDLSALRLIYWIATKAEATKHSQSEIPTSREELQEKLYLVWGQRLSKSNSVKEAFTHRWVLGALANFKQQIQSRDIVRFLEEASKLSQEYLDYNDRILVPSAIKDSIVKVGKEKIIEVKKENFPLKPILEKLEEIAKNTQTSLKFPCTLSQLEENNIMRDGIKLLEENGIIIQYSGEYYMAEIYRKGFGFENSKTGKPKVLYLY